MKRIRLNADRLTKDDMMDGYSWAMAVEVMKLFGGLLPATEGPQAFFDIYVRAMAAMQCLEERHREAQDATCASKN